MVMDDSVNGESVPHPREQLRRPAVLSAGGEDHRPVSADLDGVEFVRPRVPHHGTVHLAGASPDWPRQYAAVVAVGSEERMLLFRDRLRSHPDERDRYERTKRELAARRWTHAQDYAEAKSAVVEEIIARARRGRS